jgi:predicted ArsR family transcriptional regulator
LTKVCRVDDGDVAAVAALADPTRRRVYDAVARNGNAVGRDDVAAELGIGRTLAAFHLERLAECGLLEYHFERGAAGGRPAKLYRRSGTEKSFTVPPRSYVDAAELLAEALELAGADATLHQVAERHGRKAKAGQMWEALRERGYEPCEADGLVKLRNCPFHVLAQEFPPLVCGMNLALLTGLAKGGKWKVRPKMRPEQGYCCVVLEGR